MRRQGSGWWGARAVLGVLAPLAGACASVERAAPPPAPLLETPPAESDSFSRLVMLLGWRGYGSEWEPFDDQAAFQFSGHHEWRAAPVGVEYGVGFAGDSARVDGRRLDSSSFDLWLGATRTFPLDEGRLWFLNVGSGLTAVFHAEDERTSFSFRTRDDEWLGGYVHAGLFRRIGWNWDVVIDLRYAKGGDVDLPGGTREGEYVQLAIGSGFSW